MNTIPVIDLADTAASLAARARAAMQLREAAESSGFFYVTGHGVAADLVEQMPGGGWCAAMPLAGSFVVNLGDMIPRWTHGRYHSNPHRVRNVASGGRPRYSIPFFYNPDYEARIEPLPSCLTEGTAPEHLPCTAGEHLREMYEKTYAAAK